MRWRLAQGEGRCPPSLGGIGDAQMREPPRATWITAVALAMEAPVLREGASLPLGVKFEVGRAPLRGVTRPKAR